MNEFVEQFLIESRELVEQAVDDLLALEQTPTDRDRLDGAFRAFHTLKGSAGIIEFAAMGRALHAAEDALAGVRAGADPITPDLISDGLACLDQVVQWLDSMQATGAPPADADAAADAMIARFGRASAGSSQPATLRDPSASPWWEALATLNPAAADQALSAIRYRPDPGCFFSGEDPLARMEALPGLLALDIAPDGDGPALEDLDPFTCLLTLSGLVAAPADELATLLAPVAAHVEIYSLEQAAVADLSPAARELIEAQVLLLAAGGADGFAGRAASACRTVANVLRHAGRIVEADHIEQMSARSGTGRDAGPLMAALEAVLAGRPPGNGSDRKALTPTPHEPAPRETTARGLRIEIDRIDALVRLTGELTVVKNAIGHVAGVAREGADPKALADRLKDQHVLLDRLVGELQRSVLGVRVLPMRHVFQRFPRLVREMGVSLGKPTRLITEGDATQADKAIVEALFEPLLHVLLNAVDHGLEPPEARAALGKPTPAVIRLRAERRGEHVVVEVEDDGGGVDVARVRQVAAERGVASLEQLGAMSDAEVANLVFTAGFSTAREVTGLSGRGVGMDAVRVAVERLGGQVRLESRPGEGATVRFILPFTVMMTRVMTVEAGGQVFGLPLDAVIETTRVAREQVASVGAARAFVLRNRTVPVFDLAESLGVSRSEAAGAEATLVVATAAGQLIALEVERVGERMNVMLKPMDGLLSGMPGVAGTTLLGDGRVLIVLDLQELLL